jgi:hypothetical protein
MKFFIFLLFCALCIVNNTFAQAPTIQWQKCVGGSRYDVFFCIIQTTDGGYIAAGNTESNDGDVSGNHDTTGNTNDAWVVKFDSIGNIKWQKCYGGSLFDSFFSIIQTIDGGYIAAGGTASTDGDVIGGGYHGGGDVWVVKLDTGGHIKWQKCYGGSSDEGANSIQQTSDSGYIIVGRTESNDGEVTGFHQGCCAGIYDSWVIKIDSIGHLQWQKCLGGTSDDEGYDIQQTYDSGYIIANHTSSIDGDVTCTSSLLPDPYWLVKLNSYGAIQWQKCLGGSGGQIPESVRQTTDSGYILGSSTNSDDGNVSGLHGPTGGNPDIWIVKTDRAANLQHQRCLGGFDIDYGACVRQTKDSGYIVIGEPRSTDGDVTGNHGIYDAWVVKLDTALNIEWQKCFGGSLEDENTFIEQTKDGGYIFVAYTNSNDGDVSGNHGGGDGWVVKLSREDVGVNELASSKEKFIISPNPIVSEELNLTYSQLTEQAIVSIFNIDCKEVARLTPALSKGEGEIHLKLPELASGMYFVVLHSGERRMTGRFVKQ